MKVLVIVFLTLAAQLMSFEVLERGTAPTTPTPDCEHGKFACGLYQFNETFCIPPHHRCDKTYDCHDKSDESNCNYRQKHDGDHECKPLAGNQVGSLWIPSKKVCDGYYDCRDHSDEQDCDKSRVSCELSEFLCEDGIKCIQKYQKCDNISDCHDNSDEKDCSKSSWRSGNDIGQLYDNVTPNPTGSLSGPYFVEGPGKTVIGIKGKTSNIACSIKNLGNMTVSWFRHHDTHLLTSGMYRYTPDDRFSTLHKPSSENWVLEIRNTLEEDEGVYECQISTTPIRSLRFNLKVVGSCEDKNKYCAWAATFGECKKNPGLMLENCPAACDQCKTECKNKNSNCYFWASIGECIKNPNYMLTYCKPACSQCEPYNYKNTNVDCDFWASIGECKKNPGYMLINCSKACATSQPLNDDDYDYPLSNRL